MRYFDPVIIVFIDLVDVCAELKILAMWHVYATNRGFEILKIPEIYPKHNSDTTTGRSSTLPNYFLIAMWMPQFSGSQGRMPLEHAISW